MHNNKLLLFALTVLPYVLVGFFVIDIFTCRFTDQFLIGTHHGNVGYDFYSVPRSFINLQHGRNIFNTEYANWYGPYATPYYYHPLISIAIGSWLSLMPAHIAFKVFVTLIAIALLMMGNFWSKYFNNPFKKRMAVLLTTCSLPVYLVLWNAQMHIFTVIAVVLILTSVIDLAHNKEANSKLITGLLFSLFSKPIALLWIPVLLIIKDTRVSTIKALVIYLVVSAVFFIVPWLQPEQENILHWKNIVGQTTSISNDKEFFSFATTFPLPLPGKLKNSLYLLVPLLLWFSATKLNRLNDAERRMRLLLTLLVTLLSTYYFAYTMVWEYHYTTILAAMPAILYLYDTAAHKERRRWSYIFSIGVLLYLPTIYFLRNRLDQEFILLMKLCKVLPVTLLLAGLIMMYYKNRKAAIG